MNVAPLCFPDCIGYYMVSYISAWVVGLVVTFAALSYL